MSMLLENLGKNESFLYLIFPVSLVSFFVSQDLEVPNPLLLASASLSVITLLSLSLYISKPILRLYQKKLNAIITEEKSSALEGWFLLNGIALGCWATRAYPFEKSFHLKPLRIEGVGVGFSFSSSLHLE